MRNHVTALLLVVFAFQIKPTTAGHHEEHSLTVGSVWARATPGQTTNGSVYLTIKNNSPHSDELIKAHSNLAARTMLHTHIMDKGVAQMRHINSIPIPKNRNNRNHGRYTREAIITWASSKALANFIPRL